jgi:hypothetical protein
MCGLYIFVFRALTVRVCLMVLASRNVHGLAVVSTLRSRVQFSFCIVYDEDCNAFECMYVPRLRRFVSSMRVRIYVVKC